MKTLVASAACLFGLAGMSHAAQIASPAIYAGFSQNVAFCIIYNGGSTTQSVNVRLFDEAGNVLTSGCGAPLGPGQYCSVAKIGISNDNAYACTATARSTSALRGSMILQDGADVSLRSEPLR